MEAKSLRSVPQGANETYLNLFNEDDCVVCYVSLGFGEQIKREARWIPGVYHNSEQFRCINYYAALGKYLLNRKSLIIPFWLLQDAKDFVYERFGLDDCIFVRPDSGNKVFTGQLIKKEEFDDDLGHVTLSPGELVVVAEPRNVVNEWRFVVADGKVITGSQYVCDDKLFRLRCTDDKAWQLAQEIADQRYDPDRLYCIDICQTKAGNYYLLEIGCFSCAGFYACNLEIIVREASRIALDQWEHGSNQR